MIALKHTVAGEPIYGVKPYPPAGAAGRSEQAVRARVPAGLVRAAAIREISALAQHGPLLGPTRSLSERTVFRWLRTCDRRGLAGLEPQSRPRSRDSEVLIPLWAP